MNFNSKAVPLAWSKLSKILLVMKLTAILIIAALTNVSAKTFSQTVSLRQKNASVEKVLRLIEKQTGYHFMYDKNDVSKAGGITIDVDKVSIDQALVIAFKDQPLTYKIFQETIVVKKKDADNNAVEIKAVDITGTITDAKGPLPGVNVKLKGTTTGTTTDVNGKYKLTVPEGTGTLVFSFIGYTTQEQPINNRTAIDVVLVESPKALSEVVVVGYGTSKRVDLTGSVGSVGSKALQERPQTNLEQELAGKIAGVNVSSNSGAPGGATKVRIRGYTSLNASTNPLYVVDGVVWTEGGNSINPNDVESIDVLKDASSTAIYGTRGANGVILVTTKRGTKGGSGTVSYDSYVSVSKIAKKLDVLNAKEFLAIEDLGYANIQKYDPTGWAAGNYASKDPKLIRTALIGKLFDANLNPLYDVNWQDATTRSAVSQNHNLSFTGSSDKMNYGFFLNYADDQGIILNSYLKRYNARLTFDNQIKPWLKVGATLNYNAQEGRLQDNGTGGNNIPRMLVEMPSIIPIRYPDGSYGKRTDYPNLEGGDNPVAQANEIVNLTKNRVFSGNTYANINILPSLQFRSVLGVTTSANYTPNSQTGLVGGASASQDYSSASISEANNVFWQWSNYFTYDKTFGIHKINLVAGFERQNFKQTGFGASTSTLSDNFYSYYNLGAGAIPGIPSSNYDAWQMQSFFARLNYNLKEKYLLTVTGRQDGSSRLGKNNKTGFFPSAALAWRASQESFLKDNKTISDLKLRLSYGLTGNTEIGEYRSTANIETTPYVFGGAQAIGTHQTSIGNEELGWEKNSEIDFGVSLGLFNNRINIEADAFLKKTQALLLDAPIPQSSGFGSVFKNIGKLQNKGIELAINTTNIKSENFSWTSNFNITFLNTRILALGQNNDDIFLSPGFLSNFNLMRVGLSPGSFYGYTVLGTWSTSEAAQAASYNGLKPGDLKIKDTNGDGKITADDREVLGKSTPDGFGTFSNNFRYKGIELGIELQFNYGNQIMNLTKHSGQDRTGQANSYATVLDAWTPEHQNTSIAETRPAYVGYQTEIYSTKVENGNFIRGRSVTLGYNFADNVLKKLKVSRLRVYAQAQNLFIITKYSGYDPEVSTYNNNSNFTQGIQFYDYPKPRTFLLGVNVSF